MKILMADDDADDRHLFSLAFKEAFPGSGYAEQVLEFVRDGIELLDYLRNNTGKTLPDLIFLDLNMPRKNGRDVLKEIKLDRQLKNIPIVIMTTSQSEDDRSFCLKNGACNYIEKPFDFYKWPGIIKNICESIKSNLSGIEQKKS
jgi:CheY-like chemotaxis protein